MNVVRRQTRKKVTKAKLVKIKTAVLLKTETRKFYSHTFVTILMLLEHTYSKIQETVRSVVNSYK